jgi:hypothetical protein
MTRKSMVKLTTEKIVSERKQQKNKKGKKKNFTVQVLRPQNFTLQQINEAA